MTKIFTIIATIIIACACVIPACADNAVEEIYAITTVVIELNADEDTVACQDFNGNVWVFYGVEDWCEGDVATLTMWDAGTELIYDDEVLDVRYSGWFDLQMLDHWLNH